MSASARAGSIAVTAAGGISPLGPTWVQTCASIRAGLNRFADHPYYEAITPDPEWDAPDPLRCSMMPGWQERLDEPQRLTDLAMEALRELTGGMSLERRHLPRGGLLVALPGEREHSAARDPNSGVVEQLVDRTGLDAFALAEAREGGHAGFFLALREAMSLIRSGQLDYCIVGGADTYFIDTRLDALDQGWRLKTGRNPDGFLPGEAAIMLLLTAPRLASALGTAPLAIAGEVGIGQESRTIEGDLASTGEGLAQAIGAALGDGRSPARVICDLNGESYRAFEWGLLQARLGPLLGEVGRLSHPADCLGDVGAATGALLVACAAHGFARREAPAGPVLLWAGSDDGTRAAMTLTPPPVRKG